MPDLHSFISGELTIPVFHSRVYQILIFGKIYETVIMIYYRIPWGFTLLFEVYWCPGRVGGYPVPGYGIAVHRHPI